MVHEVKDPRKYLPESPSTPLNRGARYTQSAFEGNAGEIRTGPKGPSAPPSGLHGGAKTNVTAFRPPKRDGGSGSM